MYSAKVTIPSKKSRLIYNSIIPDIKNDKHHKIKMKTSEKMIIFEVKTDRLSHLKSILSSYISLINLLEGLE